MKKTILTMLVILAYHQFSNGFCGFYVAKAGAELYNNKSEVILVRDGENSVITMSNDFEGNVKDFAMVVPVPNVLSRSDIKVANPEVFKRLDAYSAPRLVEYYDQNPCNIVKYYNRVDKDLEIVEMEDEVLMAPETVDAVYGVKIEAKYDVEEYEILILSAKKSQGLKQWLVDNGYKIPAKAEKVLEPYIKSGLKFFVVKVNLQRYNPQTNDGFLRPLQIKVKSEKFMLPIRLGMANANGEQDMIVYAFSKKGRVECSNYRTVNLPTNRQVPTFVKPNFGNFFTDLFRNQHQREGRDAIFLEYAWNVTPTWSGVKCDPCVGSPPYATEFTWAGIPWANSRNTTTFFTRLHVRYKLDKFPEDLFFLETPNQEHYQARYVITHPATGDLSCDAGKEYMLRLKSRRRKELANLGALAQWNTDEFYDYVNNGTDKLREVDEQNSAPIVPVKKKEPPFGFFVLLCLLFLYSAYTLYSKIELK